MARRGLLALAALLCLSGAAQADSLTVAVCGTLPLAYTPGDVRNDTVDVNGNKCISGNITATAVTAATAANSLPTVAAGAGPVFQSLGGAQYVQPVFDSENGGGAIVGVLNPFPVEVLNTPSVSSTGVQAVICVSGCAGSGGTQSVSSTGQLSVYVLGTPTVSSTGTASVNCANCSGSVGTVTTTQGTTPWVVSSTGQSNVGIAGTASVSTTGQSWITGTVALLGTPSVSTTGQQSVYILGTPTVSSTGVQAVNVVNTPTVSTTGQQTVLVGGTPSVSSTGDSWITGTVQIQGTPAVSTTGQQFVYVLGTPTVSTTGDSWVTGTLSSTGQLSVYVLGTPTVSTTGQQTVLVGGIPTVSSTGVQAVNVVNMPTVSTTGQQTVLVGGTPTVSSTGVQGVNVVNTPAVSGTGQQWVTGTVLLTGTVAASDTLANPTTSNVLAYLLGWDPTNSVWRRVQVQAGTGAQIVSSTGQQTVLVGGTPVVSSTGLAGVVVVNTPAVSSTGDSWVTGTFRLQDATSTPVQNVKAASTSATSTDTAAVVALSPNPSTICTSFKNVSVATSTDLITSAGFLHICGIMLVAQAAEAVSLVEGTGSVCASGESAIMGGTLTSSGMFLAANGGFSQVSGIPFLRTKTQADHLCVILSASVTTSGYISYVDHQ